MFFFYVKILCLTFFFQQIKHAPVVCLQRSSFWCVCNRRCLESSFGEQCHGVVWDPSLRVFNQSKSIILKQAKNHGFYFKNPIKTNKTMVYLVF